MPTIRGHAIGINNAEFTNFINNYIARQITIVKNAGLIAMEKIRKTAVNTWYDSTAKHAMNASTHYEVKHVKQNKDKIEVVFMSYVDESEFEALKAEASGRNLFSSPYSSVVMWRQRHEKDGWRYYGRGEPRSALSMPYSVGEYMFNLPWKKGILGLPPYEKHTGTGWVNPDHSKKRKPLKGHVESYFKKNWEKEFMKTYNGMKSN